MNLVREGTAAPEGGITTQDRQPYRYQPKQIDDAMSLVPWTGASASHDEAPRCFDDVFSFFEGSSGLGAATGGHQAAPRETADAQSHYAHQEAQPTGGAGLSFGGNGVPRHWRQLGLQLRS